MKKFKRFASTNRGQVLLWYVIPMVVILLVALWMALLLPRKNRATADIYIVSDSRYLVNYAPPIDTPGLKQLNKIDKERNEAFIVAYSQYVQTLAEYEDFYAKERERIIEEATKFFRQWVELKQAQAERAMSAVQKSERFEGLTDNETFENIPESIVDEHTHRHEHFDEEHENEINGEEVETEFITDANMSVIIDPVG